MSATFQRAMDVIHSSVKYKPALLYLNYIVVFAKTVRDHISPGQKALTLLKRSGVALKLEKVCSLPSKSIILDTLFDPAP